MATWSSRPRRVDMASGTAKRGWNRLHSLWASSRWLHLLSRNPCFDVLLSTDILHLAPCTFTCTFTAAPVRQASFVSRKRVRGHRLFVMRFCCAKHAPVTHAWVRLTSFKSLCSGLKNVQLCKIRGQELFPNCAQAMSCDGWQPSS